MKEAEQFSFRQCRSDVSSQCVIHGQEEGLDRMSPFFLPGSSTSTSVGAMVFNWWNPKALVCPVCGQLSWPSLTGTLVYSTFFWAVTWASGWVSGAIVEDPAPRDAECSRRSIECLFARQWSELGCSKRRVSSYMLSEIHTWAPTSKARDSGRLWRRNVAGWTTSGAIYLSGVGWWPRPRRFRGKAYT